MTIMPLFQNLSPGATRPAGRLQLLEGTGPPSGFMTGVNCWELFDRWELLKTFWKLLKRPNKINHQQRDWRQRLSHLRHLLRSRPRPFLPLLLEQLSHCKCRKNLDSSLKSTDEDASLLDRFSSTSIKLCLQIIRHLYFNPVSHASSVSMSNKWFPGCRLRLSTCSDKCLWRWPAGL